MSDSAALRCCFFVLSSCSARQRASLQNTVALGLVSVSHLQECRAGAMDGQQRSRTYHPTAHKRYTRDGHTRPSPFCTPTCICKASRSEAREAQALPPQRAHVYVDGWVVICSMTHMRRRGASAQTRRSSIVNVRCVVQTISPPPLTRGTH